MYVFSNVKFCICYSANRVCENEKERGTQSEIVLVGRYVLQLINGVLQKVTFIAWCPLLIIAIKRMTRQSIYVTDWMKVCEHHYYIYVLL